MGNTLHFRQVQVSSYGIIPMMFSVVDFVGLKLVDFFVSFALIVFLL